MTFLNRLPRRFLGIALAAVALSATACKDSHDHDDVDVDFMRLTVGAQTITVNSRGDISGGPVTIPTGVATSVTGEFLDANQSPSADVTADEFQLSVTPNAGISFARTGPFTGTITASATGTIVVRFGLLHVPESHHDFGPFQVPVTVTAPVVVADISGR